MLQERCPKKQPRSTPNSLVRNIFDNKPNIYAELDQLAESNAKKITEVLTLMGSGNVKIKPNHQYAKAISEGLIRVLLKNNLLDKHHTDLLYKIMDEEEDKAKIFIDSRIQDVKQQITIDNIVKAQKKKTSDDSADWEDE